MVLVVGHRRIIIEAQAEVGARQLAVVGVRVDAEALEVGEEVVPQVVLDVAGDADQDAAHHPGADCEEVGTILPTHIGNIDQAYVGFVHQGGGLQRVFPAFGVKMPSTSV